MGGRFSLPHDTRDTRDTHRRGRPRTAVSVAGLAVLLLSVAASGAIAGAGHTRSEALRRSARRPSTATSGSAATVPAHRAHAPRRHRVVNLGAVTWPIPNVFRSTPVTAQAAALVVAVTFKDQPAPQVPLSTVNRIYFGAGAHTVAGYFRWASYGDFQLRGAVVGGSAAGQSTVWLTLPHSRAYYAMGNSGMGTGAQANDAVGGDRLEGAVLKLLDGAHFNWVPYENSEGKIPYLILAAASPDAALTGSGGDLWSYEESASDNPITLPDGSKSEILNYDLDAFFGMDLNTLNGLGTLCHEFSHILGALDLYDTNGSIGGLGGYSLMGTGNYNGPGTDGQDPSDEDAFTRLQLGWSVPTIVPDSLARAATVVTLPPAELSPDVLEIPVLGSTSDYLIENRQPIGMDAYLPSHGLLVYRVDTGIASTASAAWANDCLECVTGKGANPYPAVELIGAGGTGDLASPGSAGSAGSPADAYPGSDNVTALTDQTQPSDRLPNGVDAYLSLTHIQQDFDGDITFVVSTTAATVAPTLVSASQETPQTLTLTDPRTLPGGQTFALGGPQTRLPSAPAGADAVTLTLPANLPAGVLPVYREGTALPLAYVLATPSSEAVQLTLSVPKAVRSGLPTTVSASLETAQGVPVAGNFGPVEVDGTVIGTLENGTVQGAVRLSGRGSLALTARLVDLPQVSAQTSVTVHVTPVATAR